MGANFEVSLAFAVGLIIFVEAAKPAAAAVPFLRKSRRRIVYLLIEGRSLTSRISCRADARLYAKESLLINTN
jgi:hypothetical protein